MCHTVSINEQMWHRHTDHLREREINEDEWSGDTEDLQQESLEAADSQDRIPEESLANPC